jgi:hypothetical protein
MYGAPPGSFNVVYVWVDCGKRSTQHGEKKCRISSYRSPENNADIQARPRFQASAWMRICGTGHDWAIFGPVTPHSNEILIQAYRLSSRLGMLLNLKRPSNL